MEISKRSSTPASMAAALASCLILLPLAWSAEGQLPLQPGEAVATCFSDNRPGGFVLGVYDVTDLASHGPPTGQALPIPVRHHPSWTRQTLGEVFGIALDDAPNPNIYVTSAFVYNNPAIQLINVPATGQVFKIDGTSGQAQPFGQPLANAGEGLGNIAYDPQHQQFYVTNFFDGKIYRLSSNGLEKPPAFDPFQPHQGPAPAPVQERVWGVGVYQGRLYFGTWGSPSAVWSVGLDSSGAFVGPAVHELTLPPNPESGKTRPVSDITFSADGRMLLAERTMAVHPTHGVIVHAHDSRVLELVGGPQAWVASGHDFSVGDSDFGLDPDSAAGGVAYACSLDDEGRVVATGDALSFRPRAYVYGLQLLPAAGGDGKASYLVDLDGNVNRGDKRQIGDVEVYNTCHRQCSEITFQEILCGTDDSGDVILRFKVKNLSQEDAYHLFLVNLPPGVTASPDYVSLSGEPGGFLPPGQASLKTYQVTLQGASLNQPLSFQLTLHNEDLAECCATEITVTPPACDCAQVIDDGRPLCRFEAGGGWTYQFTLQSLFADPMEFLFLVPESPEGVKISPSVVDFGNDPLDFGASATVEVTIQGAAGGQEVCFLASGHRGDFSECCSIRRCVRLPFCPIDPWLDPIDHTTILLRGSETVITDPRGSDPGVSLPHLEAVTGVDFHWRSIPSDELDPGDYLEQTLRGRVDGGENQALATLRTVRTARGAHLVTSFPALDATRYRYELFRDGQLVGVQENVPKDVAPACCPLTVTTDAHFTLLGPTSVSQSGGTSCDGSGPRCLFAGYTFPGADAFTFPHLGTVFEADEVRVFPEDGRGGEIELSTLDFRAAGLSEVTLRGFHFEQDCNGNGVDDFLDVEKGGARDLDQDGVPDECSSEPEPEPSSQRLESAVVPDRTDGPP